MSLDQENFEKLESFVEGTLDAEGKAQMQKLLAENPQLQRMMTELIAQRQMLRNLPRADAPEDLLESFQGQLEREALLGEPTSHVEMPARRVERWPHLVLAAAIVFLMLGLAGLIYEVLPRHRETMPLVYGPGTGVNVGPDVEKMEPASGPTTNASAEGELRPNSLEGGSLRSINGENSFAGTRLPATQNGNKSLAKDFAGVGGQSITGEGFQDGRDKLSFQGNTSPIDEPVVIEVRSGYPAQAASQVAEFLNFNKIAFETSPAGALGNRQLLQQEGEPAAPGSLGVVQQSIRRQEANGDIVKALPVTLPSQVATTQTDEGPVIRPQNGLADRNGLSPGQQVASGQITYRAMLTEQQVQRLNAQLLNQPNQWTEVRGEASGRILSDALPPNAMQNAVVIAKSSPVDKSGLKDNYTINGSVAASTAPSPTTAESNFAFVSQFGGGATSEPVPHGGQAFGGGFILTTQPTTLATTTAQSRIRACVIIVNSQPVDFPAPATEPATLPATAPASQPLPTSQP